MKQLDIIKNEKEDNKENNIVYKTHVSLREFILFKEEFLKSLGEFKKEINSNLLKEKQKNDLFLEKTSKLISSLNNENNFLTKINFIEEKNEIISYIKKMETNFNEQIMINKLNLSTYQKDFSNACFKYDKIITDNLLISGLIGTACKFPNLKDYILNNKEEMSINAFETKKNALELKEHKKKLDNIHEQLKYQIMTLKNNLQAYTELKINEMNEKYEDFTKTITEKIGTLNLKNNELVENLIKQEEKLINEGKYIEKYKDEIIENNNNTINIIKENNQKVNNQLTQAKNEFKSHKKNIIDLSMLLSRKGNEKNKKTKDAIINSFNDMMSELIKETFIKEKKNEFNYNNYNNYNINNNNYPNLIIPNTDNHNNESNGINKMINIKQPLKLRILTNNKNNNELDDNNKKHLIKNVITKNNSQEETKYNFPKKDVNINNNNNKISNENNNNYASRLIKRKSSDKNQKTFIFGEIKTEENLNQINNYKKESNITENDENKKNKDEDLNKINLKKNKSDIENNIYNNYKIIKEIENNIISIKENKIQTLANFEIKHIKDIKKKDNYQKSENEQITILKEEEKEDNNDESSSEKEKINNKLIVMSRPIKKSKHESNEKPKNNRNYIDTYPNSFNNSIDNKKLKTFEKSANLLNQNKKYKTQNNIKIINNTNIKNINNVNRTNNEKKIAPLDFNNDKRCQTLKKNNVAITKNIYSLYDYLKSNKVQKNISNNQTEDIDSSNLKIKEKTNIINLKNISKNLCNKEFLEKINIIKDEEIIDKPLLCNQENFEVKKGTGDIEKKILHLEFFMKKKFDELVKEIKIFIPIHFNSYTRNYNIIEK